jgi:hypothetical protein
MVILNQARGLGTLSFLAAQTSLRTQAWHAVAGQISVPTAGLQVGVPAIVSLQAPGVDLSQARITWEMQGVEPCFGQTFTCTLKNSGSQSLQAEALLPDGRRIFATTNVSVGSVNLPQVLWVDDSVPAGASSGADGGDSWNWVNNPVPNTGAKANQSAVAAGSHQHYFYNAATTLQVGTGDVLFAYVYLDPANPPNEIMLQWNDGTWEHRAYWGANSLGYGTDGTPGRRNMGALPPAGTWVQLSVPAAQVNLEGRTLNGMAFTLFGGRATWDTVGRRSPASPTSSTSTPTLALSSNGATISWNSTVGGVYQVKYKNNLMDSTWSVGSGPITATSSTTSWTDTTAVSARQRFYQVVQTQ